MIDATSGGLTLRASVLVDANVLIDIISGDPKWSSWSSAALADVIDRTEAVINPIIYAEVAAGFSDAERLDAALPQERDRREDLPWDAAYLAGQAFVRYRREKGAGRSPLADFYIGAHAAVGGYRLLTRDEARHRTYFPAVPLIVP